MDVPALRVKGSTASFIPALDIAHRVFLVLFLASLLRIPIHQVQSAQAWTHRVSDAQDMVHGTADGQILYVTTPNHIVRIDTTARVALEPIVLDGLLRGIDLSPSGDWLAVADAKFDADTNWIHLVPRRFGQHRKLAFPKPAGTQGTSSVAFGEDGLLLVSCATKNPQDSAPLWRVDIQSGEYQEIARTGFAPLLAPSGDRRRIRVGATQHLSLPGGTYEVASGKWTPSLIQAREQTLLATDRDGGLEAWHELRGWHIEDNGKRRELPNFGPFTWGIANIVGSPVSDTLFAAVMGNVNQLAAIDLKDLSPLASTSVGVLTQPQIGQRFMNGHLKTSADGKLVFLHSFGEIVVWEHGLNLARHKQVRVTGMPTRSGIPSPLGYGVHRISSTQLTLTNQVPDEVNHDGTRYRFQGWILNGNAQASNGNRLVWSPADQDELQIQWKPIQHEFRAGVQGGGKTSETSAWVAHDETFTVLATPDNGRRFLKWSGDVSEAEATLNPLSVRMDKPRAVVAWMEPASRPTPLPGFVTPGVSSPFKLGQRRFIKKWERKPPGEWRWTTATLDTVCAGWSYWPLTNLAGRIAFDMATGGKLWGEPAPEPPSAGVSDGQSFYFYDPTETGGTLTRRHRRSGLLEMSRKQSLFPAVWSPRFARADSLVINGQLKLPDRSQREILRMVNPQDGTFHGQIEVDPGVRARYTGTGIFLLSPTNVLQLHERQGTVARNWPLVQTDTPRSIAGIDGCHMLLVSPELELSCLQMDTGEILWNTPTYSSGFAIGNHRVWSVEHGYLVERDIATGKLTSDSIFVGGVVGLVVLDDVVILQPLDQNVRIIDRRTGTTLQTLAGRGLIGIADGILLTSESTIQAWTLEEDLVELTVRAQGPAITSPEPFQYGTQFVSKGIPLTNTAPATFTTNGVLYRFAGWNVIGSDAQIEGSSIRLAPLSTTTLECRWEPEAYEFEVSSGANGQITSPQRWQNAGGQVTLLATPNSGYRFVRWEGDVTAADSTNNPISLNADKPRIARAVFDHELLPGGFWGSWETDRGATARDSYARGSIGQAPFARRWSRRLGGFFGEPLRATPSAVYFLHQELGSTRVKCLSAFSGQTLWEHVFETTSSSEVRLELSGGNLVLTYLGFAKAFHISVLDPITGTVRFQTILNRQANDSYFDVGSRLLVGDNYYYQNRSPSGLNYVSKFSLSTGQAVGWSHLEKDLELTLSNGSLILSLSSEALVAHTTQVQGYHRVDPAKQVFWPETAAMAEGTLVIGTRQTFLGTTRSLLGIDLNSYKQVWMIPWDTQGAPVSIANRAAFARTSTGVRSIQLNTGESIRSYEFSGEIPTELGSAPIVTDDTLIWCGDSKTTCWDLASGAFKQAFPAGGVVAFSGGVLYALKYEVIENQAHPVVEAWSPHDEVPLIVQSKETPLGMPFPFSYGTNLVPRGSIWEIQGLSSPEISPGTRWGTRHWTGTGDIPSNGLGNHFQQRLTQASSIEWSWKKEHIVTVSVEGPGTIQPNPIWVPDGEAITLTPAPKNGAHFVDWKSDFTSRDNPLRLTVSNPLSLIARFEEDMATNGVPLRWLEDYGIDRDDQGALADPDSDGLPNWREYSGGADPFTADTDRDGFDDATELRFESQPENAGSRPRAQIQIQGTPSNLGSPIPRYGNNTAVLMSRIVATVTPPPSTNSNETQSRVLGWTGTGSVPASGTGPSVEFTLTDHSSILWHWVTEHRWRQLRRLEVDIESTGSDGLQRLSLGENSVGAWAGARIASEGDWTVVCAPFATPRQGTRQYGAAYVFQRTNGLWDLHSTLRGTQASFSRFGGAASLLEDRLIISGTFNGENAFSHYQLRQNQWTSLSLVRPGHFVYTWNDIEPYLYPGQQFIGIPFAVSSGVTSGMVVQFLPNGQSRTVTPASLQQKLGQEFGRALIAIGDRLIVGAPGDQNSTSAIQGGGAYVYRLTPQATTAETLLQPTALDQGARFGESLATDGQLLFVAAPQNGRAGTVDVFARVETRWTNISRIHPPASANPGAGFGSAMTVSRDRLLIAAPGADTTVSRAGVVYVFRRTGAVWTHSATITSPTPTPNGRFGESLAWNLDSIFIGAPGEGTLSNAGIVYLLNGGQQTESIDSAWIPTGQSSPLVQPQPVVKKDGKTFAFSHWEFNGQRVLNPDGSPLFSLPPMEITQPGSAIAVYKIGTGPADVDADGLPDEWEAEHFGGLNSTPDGDDDGDGQSNLGEWTSGTNPRSSSSILALAIKESASANGLIRTLSWNAASNRVYQVLIAEKPDGEFKPYGAALPASLPINRVDLPIEESPRFFRVEVR